MQREESRSGKSTLLCQVLHSYALRAARPCIRNDTQVIAALCSWGEVTVSDRAFQRDEYLITDPYRSNMPGAHCSLVHSALNGITM